MNFLRTWGSKTRTPASMSEERKTIALRNRDGAFVDVEILVRNHPTARRIKLALDPAAGTPVLTIPRGIASREGIVFLKKNAPWLLQRLEELPTAVPFADGTIFPLEGKDVTIRHRPDLRGGAQLSGAEIVVSGSPDHLSRRVADFLRDQARSRIKPLAREKAELLEKRIGRITIRDQRTRWGSCASSGNLSFSWRLILAPPEILDYVVAHEAAHLVHMDHSPAFWATVARVHDQVDRSRDWLHQHGAALHRIG